MWQRKLLLDIANCSEIDLARENERHPCHKIVTLQEENSFQIPEAWNGNLAQAEVLFLSSNPSISDNSTEKYPVRNERTDEEIIRYFEDRFSDEYYKRIRYFTYMKKYAAWILLGTDCTKEDIKEIDPQRIAITEIVHCKSRNQCGVFKCSEKCAEKWLRQILRCFCGKYVVLLGKVAEQYRDIVRREIGHDPIIMPHPNARGIRDVERKNMLDIMLQRKES